MFWVCNAAHRNNKHIFIGPVGPKTNGIYNQVGRGTFEIQIKQWDASVAGNHPPNLVPNGSVLVGNGNAGRLWPAHIAFLFAYAIMLGRIKMTNKNSFYSFERLLPAFVQ